MQYSPHPFKPRGDRAWLRQRGFVMVTALIFLVVLSLLAVMAMRNSMFEERFAANDRELAVARENAELALRDAERDILGVRFDGTYCAGVCTTQRPAGHRPINALEADGFWVGTSEVLADVAAINGNLDQPANLHGVYLLASTTDCGKPIWSGANWNDGVIRTCNAGGVIGAVSVPTIAYGTFTDAPFDQQGVNAPRYLIEMFTPNETLQGTSSSRIIFRITAVGFGRTVGSKGARTSVTLQSTFSAF